MNLSWSEPRRPRVSFPKGKIRGGLRIEESDPLFITTAAMLKKVVRTACGTFVITATLDRVTIVPRGGQPSHHPVGYSVERSKSRDFHNSCCIGYLFAEGEVSTLLAVDSDADSVIVRYVPSAIPAYDVGERYDSAAKKAQYDINFSKTIMLRWSRCVYDRDGELRRYFYTVFLEMNSDNMPHLVHNYATFPAEAHYRLNWTKYECAITTLADLPIDVNVRVFPRIFIYCGRQYVVCVEAQFGSSDLHAFYRWDITDHLTALGLTYSPHTSPPLINPRETPENSVVLVTGDERLSYCEITTMPGEVARTISRKSYNTFPRLLSIGGCRKWEMTYGELTTTLGIGSDVRISEDLMVDVVMHGHLLTIFAGAPRKPICTYAADVEGYENACLALQSGAFNGVPADIIQYLMQFCDVCVKRFSIDTYDCPVCGVNKITLPLSRYTIGGMVLPDSDSESCSDSSCGEESDDDDDTSNSDND